MQTSQSLAFTASDGRPFEVEWSTPEHAQYLWRWNQDHYAGVLSPLEQWVCLDAPGRLRAYAEAGIDPPHMFRGFEVQHGFQFVRADMLSGEQQQAFVSKSRALAARFGGACRVWEAYSLPLVEKTCESMRRAPIETSVKTLSEAWNYAFHLTHVAGPAVLFPLNGRLTELLTPSFGPAEANLLAQEVGQGGDNATVASDRAIAQLARLARTEPALEQALRAGRTPTVEEFPDCADFFDYLEDFFETYGDRSQSWGIDHPTMREDPTFVWGMIRAALDSTDAPDERRSGAATRERAIERIRERLAGDPETLAAALAIADELEGYVTVREGRALWQLVSAGILRTKLLEKGDALVARGIIARRDDILFLLPDEMDRTFELDGFVDYRPLVAERRSTQAVWHGVTPPRLISGNAELLSAPPPSIAPPSSPASSDIVSGLPGARGKTTATARVVLSLDEADDLQPGEVLICQMTSPPWTPLFGLAAAIVTDSGMALSHPAIAAREYGIPAVVGAGEATTRIRSGDLIEVDGDSGTVTIVSRA